MEKPNQNSLCRWRSRIKMLRAWFCFPLFTRAVTVYLSNYILLIGECYFCFWPIRMTLFLVLTVPCPYYFMIASNTTIRFSLVFSGGVKVGSRLQGIGKRLNYLLVAIGDMNRFYCCFVPRAVFLSFHFALAYSFLPWKWNKKGRRDQWTSGLKCYSLCFAKRLDLSPCS